jgi:2-phosphosulfolactate phosphatase
MTTTNGTKALMHATGAGRVLIGAFVNLSAVCRGLVDSNDIHLLCAGTRGEITREDTLLAGAVVERLVRSNRHAIDLNDQAKIAAEAWSHAAGHRVTRERLTEALRETRGGSNVAGIGHEADIETAAHVDKFDIVPELVLAEWAIRVK